MHGCFSRCQWSNLNSIWYQWDRQRRPSGPYRSHTLTLSPSAWIPLLPLLQPPVGHNIPVPDHCTVPFRPLLSHLNPPGTHWHLFHPFLICCNLLRLGKWSCWAIQPDCGLLCACVCARVEDRMQLKINTRVAHTRYSCCNSHFKTCQSETLILIYSPAPTFAASIIECCGLQAHTWSYLVIYHI